MGYEEEKISVGDEGGRYRVWGGKPREAMADLGKIEALTYCYLV